MNFKINIMKYLLTVFIILSFSCTDKKQRPNQPEEISKAQREQAASPGKNCFSVCDINKTPDLRLVTNAKDQPQVDGVVDTNTYFWQTYHVRTHPIRLTQNFTTPASYAVRYGWDSTVVVNRVQLQCLIENIAPFGCQNDWVFTESQGYLVGANIFFDGLFEFETYEKQRNGRWKILYTDFKKEFFPSNVPNQDYLLADFCFYERAVQAQMGDLYYNYFRFPNHDGIYKLVVRFNPQIKGCRAVKETNYENNEETVVLEIKNGVVAIIK